MVCMRIIVEGCCLTTLCHIKDYERRPPSFSMPETGTTRVLLVAVFACVLFKRLLYSCCYVEKG